MTTSALRFVPRGLRFVGLLLTLGWVEAGCSDEQEPAVGSWIDVAPLPDERDGACLVPLSDGRVLAIGGMEGDPRRLKGLTSRLPLSHGFLRSVSIYDPTTDVWKEAASTNTAHAYSECFRLPSGKAIVVGHGFGYLNNPTGLGEGHASVEVYDPATDQWQLEPIPTRTRPGRSTVMLADGRLLLAGGVDEGNDDRLTPRSEADLYDPVLRRWDLVPDIPTPNGFGAGYLVQDGRVVIKHGDYLDYFDPATKTWAPSSRLNAPSGAAAAMATTGTYVLLLPNSDLDEARLLDLKTSTVIAANKGHHERRCEVGGAALPDGRFLCVGRNPSVLDPGRLSWQMAAALSPRFAEHASSDYLDHVTLDDGRVLFVASGGRYGGLFSLQRRPSPRAGGS